MFKVEDKTTGERYTVFATNGTHFLVYNEELEWWFYKNIDECRPVEEKGMPDKKKLIFADNARREILREAPELAYIIDRIKPADAVELPKGKPGDYLEWNNGAGVTQIHYIHAVMIYKDHMRYDLEKFAPVVNHPCIIRIMSREEAEAALAKMDGDRNGTT